MRLSDRGYLHERKTKDPTTLSSCTLADIQVMTEDVDGFVLTCCEGDSLFELYPLLDHSWVTSAPQAPLIWEWRNTIFKSFQKSVLE